MKIDILTSYNNSNKYQNKQAFGYKFPELLTGYDETHITQQIISRIIHSLPESDIPEYRSALNAFNEMRFNTQKFYDEFLSKAERYLHSDEMENCWNKFLSKLDMDNKDPQKINAELKFSIIPEWKDSAGGEPDRHCLSIHSGHRSEKIYCWDVRPKWNFGVSEAGYFESEYLSSASGIKKLMSTVNEYMTDLVREGMDEIIERAKVRNMLVHLGTNDTNTFDKEYLHSADGYFRAAEHVENGGNVEDMENFFS